MKKISISKMAEINGGTVLSASIAGASCFFSLAWPIGTLIFGPTCIGTVIYTIKD